LVTYRSPFVVGSVKSK